MLQRSCLQTIQKRFKPRVYYRKQKKREEMKEIAANRVWNNIEENTLEPTPIENENIDKYIPEELKYKDNLRESYREPLYDISSYRILFNREQNKQETKKHLFFLIPISFF